MHPRARRSPYQPSATDVSDASVCVLHVRTYLTLSAFARHLVVLRIAPFNDLLGAADTV